MYITATTLSMDASQLYKDVEQRVSGLTSTNGLAAARSDAFGFRLATVLASSTQTQITCRAEVDRPRNKEDPADLRTEDHDRAAAALLSSMTRQVIGQPVHIRALRDSLTSTTTPWGTEQQQPPPPGPQTVSFTSGMVYSEASTLLFSAQGSVHTADGREISFDLGLSMEQHTVAMETASFGAASLFIDPLILQFDLDSPLLDNHSFLFDLDNDDELEELACPGGGCGFLAFDRNRDGRINDGSELFGPSTGWGFGELAELDSNANLWIDENDPMFTQLLIWTPDGQGGERLISLKEAGVGAIAVTHAGTDFQLRRGDGTVIGNVTGCGLFLTENGEVRPMQEVDLAITASTAETAANPAIINGENSLWEGNRWHQPALQLLRDIISMQRLRMRMMLTGKRLQELEADQSRQQGFFDWLQTHRHWQERVVQQLGEQQSNLPEDRSLTG